MSDGDDLLEAARGGDWAAIECLLESFVAAVQDGREVQPDALRWVAEQVHLQQHGRDRRHELGLPRGRGRGRPPKRRETIEDVDFAIAEDPIARRDYELALACVALRAEHRPGRLRHITNIAAEVARRNSTTFDIAYNAYKRWRRVAELSHKTGCHPMLAALAKLRELWGAQVVYARLVEVGIHELGSGAVWRALATWAADGTPPADWRDPTTPPRLIQDDDQPTA